MPLTNSIQEDSIEELRGSLRNELEELKRVTRQCPFSALAGGSGPIGGLSNMDPNIGRYMDQNIGPNRVQILSPYRGPNTDPNVGPNTIPNLGQLMDLATQVLSAVLKN